MTENNLLKKSAIFLLQISFKCSAEHCKGFKFLKDLFSKQNFKISHNKNLLRLRNETRRRKGSAEEDFCRKKHDEYSHMVEDHPADKSKIVLLNFLSRSSRLMKDLIEARGEGRTEVKLKIIGNSLKMMKMDKSQVRKYTEKERITKETSDPGVDEKNVFIFQTL